MRELFNPFSPVMRFIATIGQACYLGILWLVTSIPVITAGASTVALYTIMLRLVKNEDGALTSSYFRAFKENFKQATLVWLILFALGVFLGVDAYVLTHMWSENAFWALISAAFIGVLIVYAMISLYIFPLMAVFENTTKMMFVNALMTAVRYLFCTILMAAVVGIAAYITIYLFTPFFLIAEGLIAMAHSYLLQGVFHALMPAEEKDDENN